MATKKTTRKVRTPSTKPSHRKAPSRAVPRTAASTTPAGRAAEALRERWDATVSALTAAEAAVERQVRTLMKKNRINPRDASANLEELGKRFGRERKKLLKQVGTRMKGVQGRLKKERKVVGRRIDDAVRATLAALNIPSRREVAELTSKVETLSRKIDSLRR